MKLTSHSYTGDLLEMLSIKNTIKYIVYISIVTIICLFVYFFLIFSYRYKPLCAYYSIFCRVIRIGATVCASRDEESPTRRQ